MENRPIPHVIKSMIESLSNPSEREHIRENYYTTLLNIKDAIDASLTSYDMLRSKRLDERERKKMRA